MAQVCSAVICMPLLVFSMMQPEIYCQPAEAYDVYIKVCCRVTACWAWWHWQITSQVTPSVHYIQTISLWIHSSSKTSSADLESSAPLFGINAGALKGQGKIYNGQAWPWTGPLTLWSILNEVEGYWAQLCTRPVYIGRITAEAGGTEATFKGGVERVHVMSLYARGSSVKGGLS